MSDQSYKPATTPAAPAVEAPTPNPRVGRGSGYPARFDVAQTAKPASEEKPASGPGFFDRLGALSGSTHLGTLLGSNASGVEWDNTEKGANKPNVDATIAPTGASFS